MCAWQPPVHFPCCIAGDLSLLLLLNLWQAHILPVKHAQQFSQLISLSRSALRSFQHHHSWQFYRPSTGKH